jgi:hypothetical protein
LASFKHFVTRSNCPTPVPAYVKESLHCFIQLQVHFPLFYFPQPLLFSLKRSETQIPSCGKLNQGKDYSLYQIM